MFTKPSGTWTWQATLTPALVHEGAGCGGAVAVQDDTALVGCTGEPVGTVARAGAVHVYTRTGATWAPSATLVAADPTSTGALGAALAFEGDNVVAGASVASARAGALYVFSRVAGTWQQVQRLAVAGAQPSDFFGSTVGLSGDLAVGGTNSAMVAGLDFSGFAAVFGGLCEFGLTPATVSAGAASGTQSVSVNASASACAWSTTSHAAWLTFDAPGTGTGDGAVTVRYTANTGPARTGHDDDRGADLHGEPGIGLLVHAGRRPRHRRAPAAARARSASRPPTPPARGRPRATSAGCRWSRPRAAPAAVRSPTRCCPTRGPPAWAR